MARVIKAFKLLFSQTKLRAQTKIVCVGEDHLGNKYFEQYRPSDWRINRRYFEREHVNKGEDFVDLTKVPPAWDAWLRYRRKDPPSLEEIEESEKYFTAQQDVLAKEMDKKKNVTTSQETPRDDKFPRRRDYETRPHLDPGSAKRQGDDI